MGPKAPRVAQRVMAAQRAPRPLAGAKRRGTEHPELLVFEKKIYYKTPFMLHEEEMEIYVL